MTEKKQMNHDTFMNKVWDKTIGKVPEKLILGVIGLTAAGFMANAGYNSYQDIKAKSDRLAEEEYQRVRTEQLVAQEDSLISYGLNLVQEGNLNYAERALIEVNTVRPNYDRGQTLEKAISDARFAEKKANDLLALRLHFIGNEYFATEDAHTLWDIAPLYFEALNGRAPKICSWKHCKDGPHDEKELGNLWMEMVEYRRALGKDTESISVGEKVELPAKGLMGKIIETKENHYHPSF